MALIPTTTSTSTSTSTSKQIAVDFSAIATNVIGYTVPSGKTFVGYFTSPSSYYTQIKINGVQTYIGIGGSAGSPLTILPLTLLAGTTIGNGVSYNNGFLIGVES